MKQTFAGKRMWADCISIHPRKELHKLIHQQSARGEWGRTSLSHGALLKHAVEAEIWYTGSAPPLTTHTTQNTNNILPAPASLKSFHAANSSSSLLSFECRENFYIDCEGINCALSECADSRARQRDTFFLQVGAQSAIRFHSSASNARALG